MLLLQNKRAVINDISLLCPVRGIFFFSDLGSGGEGGDEKKKKKKTLKMTS